MSDDWEVKGRHELDPVDGISNLIGKVFGIRESTYTVQNKETGDYGEVHVTTDGSTKADMEAIGAEIAQGNIKPL